jgi:hypothetical protein
LILHELDEETPFDHDLIAGSHPVVDLVLIAQAMIQGDVLPRKAAVGLGHIDERQVLIVTQYR